jgi:ribosome biogenesis GTPase / thiamine phosphate phosphatase
MINPSCLRTTEGFEPRLMLTVRADGALLYCSGFPMSSDFSLSQLGWRAHFSQQLSIDDLDRLIPARIAGVHRSGVTLWSHRGVTHVLAGTLHGLTLTVGDWVLANRELNRIERLLERTSFLARMAAGEQQRVQPIAANLDLLFVVTSCNEDFNASRLERYLAIAHEARVPLRSCSRSETCARTSMRCLTICNALRR